MGRAPLVAFIALVGFVVLIALGTGRIRGVFTPVSRTPVGSHVDRTDTIAPHQALPDTGSVPGMLAPVSPETMPVLPDMPLERAESTLAESDSSI